MHLEQSSVQQQSQRLKRRGPTGWALTTILLALSVSWRTFQVEAAAGSESSHDLVQLLAHQRRENLTEQKCRPVLNFALPQVDQQQQASLKSKRAESDPLLSKQPNQKLSQSIPDSFSFAIGDINLPLTQTGGPNGAGATGSNGGGAAVQAAMKLLAAFDSQLYGGDEEDGPTEEEREQNLVRFKRNRLYLAGLNFTMLNVHLYQDAEPRFAIGVNIANTTLAGQFQYDGYAPSSLMGADYSKMAGHYRMSIDNLLLTVASNLTKVFVGETSPSAKYSYHLASNALQMNISNLGYISIEILDAEDSSKPTSNYVLKMLQRVLQKTIKRTYNKFEDYIRSTLELEGRQFLDCELTRFSPLLSENLRDQARNRLPKSEHTNFADSSNLLEPGKLSNLTYLDDLAKIIGSEMANSHLNSIALPDFEYQRSVFGSSADISFRNGSLVGLNNVKLTGETRVKLLEEHLIVNASVGWFDLRPHYNWTLYFGSGQETTTSESERRASTTMNSTTTNATSSSPPNNQLQKQQQQSPVVKQQGHQTSKPMAKGFVAFNIKAIEFDAVISKSVRSQSRMVVDELVIRRLENPKMDIGGLPGMNRLTRGAVNFFMGRLKQRLVSSIQPALKQELERALNRLAVFN